MTFDLMDVSLIRRQLKAFKRIAHKAQVRLSLGDPGKISPGQATPTHGLRRCNRSDMIVPGGLTGFKRRAGLEISFT